MAEPQKGDDHPSFFERKDGVGAGSLYTGASAGADDPGGPGWISAIFMEVGDSYINTDYL